MKDGIYLIKTWEEIKQTEGVMHVKDGAILVVDSEVWDSIDDLSLPKNRIIKIKNHQWKNNYISDWMINRRIKLKDIRVVEFKTENTPSVCFIEKVQDCKWGVSAAEGMKKDIIIGEPGEIFTLRKVENTLPMPKVKPPKKKGK